MSDADLIEEATMIRTASRELSTDPSAALRTIDAARRRFPRGQLVVEREAMRAFAHARLGRSDEAKRLAARLIEEHPTSPFSERLRTVAETGRDPVAR